MCRKMEVLILIFTAFKLISAYSSLHDKFDVSECSQYLSSETRAEIASYKPIVEAIMELTTAGEYKNKLYDDLAYFVDTFGARPSGSDALKAATEYLMKKMEESGMVNVQGETVLIPKWERGEESAEMLLPRQQKLSIKGLGFTVPTPDGGLEKELLAVSSYESFMQKSELARGKIVLFNNDSVAAGLFQVFGAAIASRFGASGVLVRSPTPFSLYTPHTGIQFYDERYPKIPAAAIAPEDADFLLRIFNRGEQIIVSMSLNSTQHEKVEGQNLIGELQGSDKESREYVALAGHMDSWDVGQGAIDDGVGVILALSTINVLKRLKLQARRTIKSMLFTAEEVGVIGGRSWVESHKEELADISVAMEADYGCLQPKGFLFSGKNGAGCVLNEILSFFAPLNATSIVSADRLYTDIYFMTGENVPGLVLDGDNGRYFWYHHTEADAMTALNPSSLDVCLGIWSSTAFILADLKEKLPRS